ncbi:MAG: RebB family R body protein [Alphaproteobacteria bacterium]|nr:RebB family R body protein [Alphaproteobacteria bacterium]
MAFPSHVNSQVTDSITEVNTLVLGDSPSMATGNMFMATSQALANTAHNATNQQNQGFVTFQAATSQGVSTLYSLDIASTGTATAEVYRRGLL